MNNEKILGFKRNYAGGDEKLVVNKCWPYAQNYASIFYSGLSKADYPSVHSELVLILSR